MTAGGSDVDMQYPSDSVEDLSTTAMLGSDVEPGNLKGGRRLVGQALLYSISAFISLGVFLVCASYHRETFNSIDAWAALVWI